MKKLQLLLVVAALVFTCTAKAQVLTGSISASVYPGDGGTITSSSLQLFVTNVISGTTGDFASTVPTGGLLTPYTGTISGLSTTPLADSINSYLVFSTQAPFGPSGTTPPNRFDFNLATIAEAPGTAIGEIVFSGTGTLVDTTGAFSSSPADFTVGFFSSANNYTISIVTVPEPASLSLITAGLVGTWLLKRGRDKK